MVRLTADLIWKSPHLFNGIRQRESDLREFLPKLHTLVLTNNRLTNLVEIGPLASLTKLLFLSLLDNNITKKPNYRLYVIHKLKSLHVLDFKKVKHKERIEAHNLFSSQEAEEEGEKESAKTFIPGEVPSTLRFQRKSKHLKQLPLHQSKL